MTDPRDHLRHGRRAGSCRRSERTSWTSRRPARRSASPRRPWRHESRGPSGARASMPTARPRRDPRPPPVAAAQAGRSGRAAARRQGPADPLQARLGMGQGRRRRQLPPERRRGAGHRRRVRLRQDDDRAVARPPAAVERPDPQGQQHRSSSGSTSCPKTEDQLRRYRWREISIVFQGAMNALNPVRRVGDQIAEPIEIRLRRVRRTLPAAGRRAAGAGRHPAQARRGVSRTSCRAGCASAR